jgi:hypothetical protein
MAGVVKKIFREIIKVVIALVVIFVLIDAAFVYMGGYWENMAVLDKISGPKRFKQFVTNPVPSNIRDLRGGYSGFPRGIVRTYFNYTGDFSDMEFLADWEKMDDYPFNKEFALYITNTDKATVYRKKRYDSYIYLIVDTENKKGVFYLPSR